MYILRQMKYAFSFVFKNKQNNVTRNLRVVSKDRDVVLKVCFGLF